MAEGNSKRPIFIQINYGDRVTNIRNSEIGQLVVRSGEEGSQDQNDTSSAGEGAVRSDGIAPPKSINIADEKSSSFSLASLNLDDMLNTVEVDPFQNKLEAEASRLLDQGRYADAFITLQQLLNSDKQSPREILNTRIKMVECLLRQKRISAALEEIEKLNNFVLESSLAVEDVMELFQSYRKGSSIGAFTLLIATGRMYAHINNDIGILGIKDCVFKASGIVMELCQDRSNFEVCEKVCNPSMQEMLSYLRQIKVDGRIKDENEAKCLNYIGFVNNVMGKFGDSVQFCKQGIQLINEPASYVLGDLLTNMGYAFHNLGKLNDAKKLYEQSIMAYQRASNYPDDKMKRRGIERAERNLQTLREHQRRT